MDNRRPIAFILRENCGNLTVFIKYFLSWTILFMLFVVKSVRTDKAEGIDMTGIEAIIYAKEKDLLRPDVRRSPEKISEILSDSFYEYGSSGSVYHYHKGNTFAHGPEKEGDWEIQDFALHLLSEDSALATYKVVKHTEDDPSRKTTLRVSLWKIEDGIWKMQFHQGTYANAPQEE